MWNRLREFKEKEKKKNTIALVKLPSENSYSFNRVLRTFKEVNPIKIIIRGKRTLRNGLSFSFHGATIIVCYYRNKLNGVNRLVDSIDNNRR